MKVGKQKKRDKKALFQTTNNTYYGDNQNDMSTLVHIMKNSSLESQLNIHEASAIAILKNHDLPHVHPDYMNELVKKYDYPLIVSYALDILFCIHGFRDALEEGNTADAAVKGITLGTLTTELQAELGIKNDKTKKTLAARKKKEEELNKRRDCLKEIATDKFNWNKGKSLTLQEWKKLKILFCDKHSLYKNTSDKTFSSDALQAGIYIP